MTIWTVFHCNKKEIPPSSGPFGGYNDIVVLGDLIEAQLKVRKYFQSGNVPLEKNCECCQPPFSATTFSDLKSLIKHCSLMIKTNNRTLFID